MPHPSMKFVTALALLALQLPLRAQQIPPEYINQAFANNLVLQEKKITLEKSLVSLKEARSMFLPTTWVDGQYLLSQGGRTIDIPAGDLVNPVYKTLNQLTGGSSFPTVNNVSEQLNPNNFYDLRIKTTMPLLNPDIKINRNIRQQQIGLQQQEVEIYKRELVKEVKQAYFNYLAAGKAITIYQSALEVVNQNLRVNQSLLANGKGLPAYVSRAESEVKQVESQLQNAGNDAYNARAYFNFLLNKPLTDSIIIADNIVENDLLALPAGTTNDVTAREELKSLALAKDINSNVLKMNQSFRSPRLNAFLDLGAQGFDFTVKDKSFFYLGGLQVTIPVFTGKRNLYKIQQTQLDAKTLALNTEQTKQQLELAAFTSRNNITTAWNTYHSSIKQEEAARKYFSLIDKGYKEGVNSFIEFLDARTQLTTAQLQVNINKYKVLSSLTDYERQTASYSLK
ncbi:MAG TPA: TolC family protein [Chitinophagaceae bacterium]|nr:TolC family protein [Chitinophagaceae bacterium]